MFQTDRNRLPLLLTGPACAWGPGGRGGTLRGVWEGVQAGVSGSGLGPPAETPAVAPGFREAPEERRDRRELCYEVTATQEHGLQARVRHLRRGSRGCDVLRAYFRETSPQRSPRGKAGIADTHGFPVRQSTGRLASLESRRASTELAAGPRGRAGRTLTTPQGS